MRPAGPNSARPFSTGPTTPELCNPKGFPLNRLILILLLILFLSCSPKEKKTFSEQGWEKKVSNTHTRDLFAPHKKKGRFFAPWMEMGEKRFLDVLGWKFFTRTDYTKEETQFLPRVLPDTAIRLAKAQGNFILWIGHNSFLIRINGQYWLTDPIFSNRALIPARVTPPALSVKEMNTLVREPNILISHNHYDHLDRDSMEKLPGNARVFVPMGLGEYVKKMHKPRTMEMDWWEEKELEAGARLVCLPAQHWSMRIDQGRNKSLWAAWLLITPEATLYFGGDSGYFKGFKAIGERFPIDYAFMATTAYHPRWFMHYQHMNAAEALKGFQDLGARYFIPTQWGTFHLGSEPPGFPGIDLERLIRSGNLDRDRYKIMDIGEILKIPGTSPWH